MKSKIALAAVAAALAVAAPAEAKTCGYTTTGWQVKAGSVTTCQFANATVNRLSSLQDRRNLFIGSRYTVWPYSRALGARVRMRCYIIARQRTRCFGGRGAYVGVFG